MAKKERVKVGRELSSTELGKFTLLNHEKLGRVLDLIEGLGDPSEELSRILALAKEKLDDDGTILALYDRLGGGVKLGDRKLVMGAFYDFAAREPRKRTDMTEDDFTDEMVYVPKKVAKSKKAESPATRVKRLKRPKKDK